MKKTFVVFYILLLCSRAALGQCNISFHGHVKDAKTGEALVGVQVKMTDMKKSAVTDDQGVFRFSGVCPGKHSFSCEYLGYDKFETEVEINKHSHPSFEMTGQTLNTVVVQGKQQTSDLQTTTQTTMQGIQLDKTRGLSLGESLKDITGLNSIQTGPGVSKPVIHGLHSNRILILNNGVRQEGQQWGSDHAPEVDPFIASDISVIKGAASIRYGSDAIAGVILLEPKKLPENPGIDGELNLVGAANNHMGAASAMMEGAFDKALTGLSWRVQGTYRRAGNAQAPHYYLDNTGFKEADYSAALNFDRDQYGVHTYFSHYKNTTGILTASHIGNINDLYQAFSSPAPIEPSVFSYTIGRPYQYVNHDLFKANGYLNLVSAGKIEAVYALQQDVREEYSPDISYDSAIAALNLPQLYFKIITHTLDVSWYHPALHNLYGSIGLSGITQGNVYRGSDFFSVIPNFRNYGAGMFVIEKWNHKKLTLEGGARYDYRWLQVYMYNVNLQYVSPIHQYSNFTTSLGATYTIDSNWSVNINYGSAWRPPGPNELYGEGVHVSAASFERGDSSLRVEKAYNLSGSLKFKNEKLTAELGLYNNTINDFIYLKPDLKPVTLISGSYPAYTYTQANVVFRGIDLDLDYHIIPQLDLYSKSTIIRAFNYSINDYLVFTPADRFENGIRYQLKKIKGVLNPYIGASNLFVAHQNRVPPNSDYVAPPAAYALFNAEAGCVVPLKGSHIEINFSVNNIGNVAYRDYLDRLRYFSDEAGRDFILRLKIPLDFFNKQNKGLNNN